MPESPICDFCSSRDVRWRYPAIDAAPVILKGHGVIVVAEAKGDWAACEICHKLIQADDRKGLVRRGAKTFAEKYPNFNMQADTEKLVHQIQDEFWAARTGPPERVI